MDTDTAVKWIIVGCGLMFAALVVGCASSAPKMSDSPGGKQETDTNLVKAEVGKVADRIVGLNKEIQQSVNQRLESQRDAIYKSGMGEWSMAIIVVAVVIGGCYFVYADRKYDRTADIVASLCSTLKSP